MILRSFYLLFTTFIFNLAVGQDSYKIDFQVDGLKDTTVYLGSFLKENTFAIDTARANDKGIFSFEGKKALPHGMYFLLIDKIRVFDFIIGDNQKFSFKTSTADYIKNLSVKGDLDNQLFFDNMKLVTETQKQVEPLVKILQDSVTSEEEKNRVREQYTSITRKIVDFQKDLVAKNPKSVTGRLLKMNTPIEIPDSPKRSDGTIDSTFQLRYYREHYFDNFDLGDEFTLRLPKVQYWNKVKDYLDRLYPQHPDTISQVIYKLVEKAKSNKETYRYLVWNCLTTYQLHPIMGMDEVYVNVVDKYVSTGEMDYWLDKKTIKNIKDYADKARRAMIGRSAPNMIMLNENLQPRSLYDLKSDYTVILFFKPTCHSCREEAPKLVDFYNKNKKRFNLEVFAVSTDTSMQEMKKFINDFKTPWVTVNGPRSYIDKHFSQLYFAESTPTLYVIDRERKIIARRLGVEQIEGLLEHHQKLSKRNQAVLK